MHPYAPAAFLSTGQRVHPVYGRAGNVAVDDRNRASYEMCRDLAEIVRNPTSTVYLIRRRAIGKSEVKQIQLNKYSTK